MLGAILPDEGCPVTGSGGGVRAGFDEVDEVDGMDRAGVRLMGR
ncbi:MAG TPA: hypothetical protein PK868_05315 [Phycicoccus sp.]|nr:hypothetical protein [Phycicoccus sp.]